MANATPATSIAHWLQFYGGGGLLPGLLLCDRHAAGRVALIFEDDSGTTELTYGELGERSSRFAGALRDANVGAGDRVGVLLPRSPDLLIALLGIWRAGAVEIPLFTAFGPDAVAYRLNRGRAAALVTDNANRPKIEPGACAHLRTIFRVGSGVTQSATRDRDFAAAVERSSPFLGEPRQAADPFIVLFTSGTTGRGKGVPVPLRALASFHAYMHYSLDLRDEDVFWNASDPGWGYGLWYGIVGSLLLGRTMILRGGNFDPAATLETLIGRGVTNFAAAATLYRSLRAAGIPSSFKAQTRLRALSSAGEPLDADLVNWSESAFGIPIHDHYGQSEVGMVIGCPHHPSLATAPVPGAVGHALPGFRVVALDENGSEREAGEGEIAIDIPDSPLYWFSGYDDDPESTAERHRHGPRYYLTSDRAHLDETGNFRFLGRDDDVITSSGYRIGPFDVEATLTSHPAVREAAVVGTPDRARGEAVTAYVVLSSSISPTERLRDALQQLVRDRLGRHLYPRRIVFTEALPRTPVGKVDRQKLRKQWLHDKLAGQASRDHAEATDMKAAK